MTSDSHNDAGFDLDQVDRLLTTTRSVRKRLDFDRDVPDRVIFDCIDLAEQAPSGGKTSSTLGSRGAPATPWWTLACARCTTPGG